MHWSECATEKPISGYLCMKERITYDDIAAGLLLISTVIIIYGLLMETTPFS
jgi:hypothetical protein